MFRSLITVLTLTIMFIVGSFLQPASVQSQSNQNLGQVLGLEKSEIDTGVVHKYEFASNFPRETRHFNVYLPTSYEPNGTRKYPVFFLLDGQNAERYVPGVNAVFADRRRAPEFITVSLSSQGVRNRDYTPATAGDDGVSKGAADQFLNFVSDELIPFIDAQYRTYPYRILSGESRGGLLALYSLIKKPALFQARFIFSPALYHNNQEIVPALEAYLQNTNSLKNWIYLNVGTEGSRFRAPYDETVSLLKRYQPAGLILTVEEMPEDPHGLTSIVGHHVAMRRLFDDWRISDTDRADGIPGVKRHLAKLSDRYGFEILPLEEELNGAAYQFFRAEQFAEAEKWIIWAIELYPNSANIYDSLAEILHASKQSEKALRASERAVLLATESNDPRVEVFKDRLERIRQSRN